MDQIQQYVAACQSVLTENPRERQLTCICRWAMRLIRRCTPTLGRPVDEIPRVTSTTTAHSCAAGRRSSAGGRDSHGRQKTRGGSISSADAQTRSATGTVDPERVLHFRTVDKMLEVTQKGIAAAWPERRVSTEYFRGVCMARIRARAGESETDPGAPLVG
jgi:hypothetical protein